MNLTVWYNTFRIPIHMVLYIAIFASVAFINGMQLFLYGFDWFSLIFASIGHFGVVFYAIRLHRWFTGYKEWKRSTRVSDFGV